MLQGQHVFVKVLDDDKPGRVAVPAVAVVDGGVLAVIPGLFGGEIWHGEDCEDSLMFVEVEQGFHSVADTLYVNKEMLSSHQSVVFYRLL